MYKIKEVADMAGVSVRTLHHYDQIGLLIPHHIGENGYRFYSDEDLFELQQILFLRELDFSLENIKKMLNNSLYSRVDLLKKKKGSQKLLNL